MAPRNPFATITTEGGLLSTDLLTRLSRQPPTVSGSKPDDYHLPPNRRLRDAINRSWTELQGAWSTFATELATLPADERATSIIRERWLLPLFAELGFGRLQRTSALSVQGHDYPVSHLWGAVPIHLLGADVDLDRRTKGVAGAASAAPFSMIQELLNRSEDHLWAILSNGRRLRLLRDNTSLTRAAYVEFDLEAMFSGQVFTDFAVLWMVCHESRFEADQPAHCWLDRWIDEARQQGVRALDRLRTGFERAITALGQGFLAHPANTALRDRLRGGELSAEGYHRQVLRLVYRLVFLLVAEDRDLFHPPDTSDEARRRYTRYYSLGRVRDHARRHRGGRHSDLFASLRPVFAALGADGLAAVGVPALGSFLWSPDACGDLDEAALSNSDLLEAVRHLAYTEQDRALQHVDFANLGPEELGSVYESLLELHPRLEPDAARFDLASAAGSERKSTGSYYTPTALISVLLDQALNPLLDEAEVAPDPMAALLAIKVLDPACGSGHFLTAAARRIATRLAAVQTGELNPTPEAVRHALRQVVGRCIYGIDLNPMAIELAKVNLWLDAVEPGLPLRFLDHHLVCGNALVGATPRLIAQGIPDEAFKAIEGDDKQTAAARKKTNAAERRQRNQGLLALGDSALAAAEQLAKAVQVLDTEDDSTPETLRAKQQHWEELQSSPDTRLADLVADTWCAAFLAPKTPDQPVVTDRTLRAVTTDRTDNPDAIALVVQLAERFRFLHPHLAFPDVFVADSDAENGWQGGFDAVLGNPPWLSYSGRQKVTIDPRQMNLLTYLYPEVSAWPSSHSAFMLRSLQLLSDQGRSGLVAPLQVFHLERYGRLRERIAQDADVRVEDMGEDVFESVTQRVGLYSLRHAAKRTAPPSWILSGQATEPSNQTESDTSNADELTRAVVWRLRTLPSFPSHSFADPGVHTGNVSKMIVSDAFPLEDPQYASVREGRDIAPFRCGRPRKRLWLQPSLQDDQYCTIRQREVYVSTPILLRQTANRPIACRHIEPTYFRNSLLACRGVSGVPDEVIVAVLNSELMRRWYQAIVQESAQKAFPQVKVRNLRRLPLFPLDRLSAIKDDLTRLERQAEKQALSSAVNASLMQEIESLVCTLYDLPDSLSDEFARIAGVAIESRA